MFLKKFLPQFSLIVSDNDIRSTQFVVKHETSRELIRELNLTGLFFMQKESLKIYIRLYVENDALAALLASGADVQSVTVVPPGLLPEVEEDAEEDDAAVSTSGIPIYYVEYPISVAHLEEQRLPLLAHPAVAALDDDGQATFESKMSGYLRMVQEHGVQVNLEPEDADDDDDDGITGGGLSDAGRQAQFTAYREARKVLEGKIEKRLNFFEKAFFEEREPEEAILTVREAEQKYGNLTAADGKPIISTKTLLADLAEEVVIVSEAVVE
ncbi:hypothetical protein EVC12_210 [Rhizobium phage RHph_I42]|nr:hypothetical protein EVC12_210 [Rhizobium phage RHph_I42]